MTITRIILEYADSGSLRSYLKENFKNLCWTDKFTLAYQLSSAVSCLHDEGIIHCDLHSQNILVHQKTIKLADFGLSRRIEKKFNDPPNLIGVIPYIDPIRFINRPVALSEESDVYSVGVLLWEISSGRPPFYIKGESYDINLAREISQGLRETLIPDAPNDYIKIYTECWDPEPSKRPTMAYVVSQLSGLIKANSSSENNSDDILNIDDLGNVLPSELSQLIQNFHKRDIDTIVTELVTLIIKIMDEGKSHDQRAVLDDYLSSHDFTIEEIYEC